MAIKKRVRATPPTLVSDEQVEDQGAQAPQHQPGRLRARCLHTADPGSRPPVVSLLCGLCETGQQFAQPPSMGLLGSRMGGTCANMITKGIKSKLLQPLVEGGNAAIAGICAPTASAKKVCHRLADQDSSLRLGLITPSHAMGLYHKTHLGAFSS